MGNQKRTSRHTIGVPEEEERERERKGQKDYSKK